MTKTVCKWVATCLMESGEEVILTARCTTEAEASNYLHKEFPILCVLDMVTASEHREIKRRKGIAKGVDRRLY